MNYKYLGKEQVTIILNGNNPYPMELDVFEQEEPNGYGHKYRYGFNLMEFFEDIEIEVFRFNGEVYRHEDRIPLYVLKPLYEHYGILH